jgi:hypothetical protein
MYNNWKVDEMQSKMVRTRKAYARRHATKGISTIYTEWRAKYRNT